MPRNLVGQLVMGFLVLVAFVWLLQVGRAPLHLVALRDCENAYAAARTAADTLVVDERPLVVGQRKTCGGLRIPVRKP